MLAGPSPSGTYYIYSFDGRLLAEYDLLGQVVRDYVYFGGQLVAEHKNGALYYYVSDQINSTRIVTDSTGTVVYSAAHEPYGGIQKTWVTTAFDPELKFSGKPRDAESGLDYFGARYYDRAQYRFVSVDPVIPMGTAQFSHQRWNLFAYCGDNPISFYDSDGREMVKVYFEKVSYVLFFYPYLQSEMAAKYKNLQEWANVNGLNIVVTDAFRTRGAHMRLGVENKTSLHQAGWAFDVSLRDLGKDNFKSFYEYCDSIGLIAEIHGDHIHVYAKDAKADKTTIDEAQREALRLLRDPFIDMMNFLHFVQESTWWFIWGSMVPQDL